MQRQFLHYVPRMLAVQYTFAAIGAVALAIGAVVAFQAAGIQYVSLCLAWTVGLGRAVVVAHPFVRRGGRPAVTLDGNGLTFHLPRGRQAFLPWGEIVAVRALPVRIPWCEGTRALQVQWSGGVSVLSECLGDWPDLIESVARHAALTQEAITVRGGEVRCRPSATAGSCEAPAARPGVSFHSRPPVALAAFFGAIVGAALVAGAVHSYLTQGPSAARESVVILVGYFGAWLSSGAPAWLGGGTWHATHVAEAVDSGLVLLSELDTPILISWSDIVGVDVRRDIGRYVAQVTVRTVWRSVPLGPYLEGADGLQALARERASGAAAA